MKIAIIHHLKPNRDKLELLLSNVPGYEVIWIADDGAEGVAKSAIKTPDLILIDLNLSIFDGVEVVRKIMQRHPCPILILTSNIHADISKVFEAMGQGALDAIHINWTKFNVDPSIKVLLLNKIDSIEKLLGKKISENHRLHDRYKGKKNEKEIPPLLVIGSSTGGPAALVKILSALPKTIPFAVVIIQHLDEKFSKGLVNWLQNYTTLPIKLALEFSSPVEGTIWVAGQNKHLVLTPTLELIYTVEPHDKPFCPSIDVFFESAAKYWPKKSIGALLTGMGSDGAYGLKKLRDAGWITIAEDSSTCIVFGMPKAAVALEAATIVLELDQIVPYILSIKLDHKNNFFAG